MAPMTGKVFGSPSQGGSHEWVVIVAFSPVVTGRRNGRAQPRSFYVRTSTEGAWRVPAREGRPRDRRPCTRYRERQSMPVVKEENMTRDLKSKFWSPWSFTQLGLLVTGLLISAGGCLMSGNYHSAKTLGKGESQFGLTFSTTRYETTTDDGMGGTETEAIMLPTVIPEITYHVGVADNVEVGGRVSPAALGVEGDVKFRFLQSDKLHLAVAPAVSYQAFVVLQGIGARLPAILTYELADNFDFTAAVFGSTTKYSEASNDGDFDTFRGTL